MKAGQLKVISTIIQWLIVLAIIAGIFFLVKGRIHTPVARLTGAEVILFALSISFTFTEVIKLFPCLKCVTGWTALLLAFIFHTPFFWMYLFVGLFVGAVFSAIKMRWL
jgi:hypothetical protein